MVSMLSAPSPPRMAERRRVGSRRLDGPWARRTVESTEGDDALARSYDRSAIVRPSYASTREMHTVRPYR
jgi:hypothetical protein